MYFKIKFFYFLFTISKGNYCFVFENTHEKEKIKKENKILRKKFNYQMFEIYFREVIFNAEIIETRWFKIYKK